MSAQHLHLIVGVVGGTGQTGSAVARALRSKGFSTRALSRTAPRNGQLDWRQADLADPPSLRRAMNGVDALYVIPPRLHPHEDTLVSNVFAAAEECRIHRLVYHSVMHPASPDVPHHMRKSHAEALLHETRLEWTILQPNTYTQNIFKRLRRSDEGLELLSLWPIDSPGLAFVDLEDLAAAAAAILSDDRHLYATHELAGPQVLTSHELAHELSRAWGLPVRPRQATTTELPPMGNDLRHLGDHYAYHSHYAEFGFPGSPYVLECILGRPATSVADVAGRTAPPT